MIGLLFIFLGITFKTRGEKLIIKLYATKFVDKNSCPFVSVLIDDTIIDYKGTRRRSRT